MKLGVFTPERETWLNVETRWAGTWEARTSTRQESRLLLPPPRESGSDEETYAAFERTADELAVRIPFLLELIEHDPSTQEVST
jgi:hypothetical protein